MPRYEFSAFVTVDAENETAAKTAAESLADEVSKGQDYLSIDDGEPIELDDDE